MGETNYKATARDVIDIDKILAAHFMMIEGQPKHGLYNGDWNDAKAAEATGNPRITDRHVARIRVELYGKIGSANRKFTGPRKSDLTARLDALEEWARTCGYQAPENGRLL